MTQLTSFEQLANTVTAVPDGIVSRSLYQDPLIRAVVFAFSPGQELSEHTAAVPAIMHLLEGEAVITLGAERVEAVAGYWVLMPAHLPHSILAKGTVKMMLYLLRGEPKSAPVTPT